jgi:hypothetical protein
VGVLIALVPALVLMREERRARARSEGADQPRAPTAIAARAP